VVKCTLKYINKMFSHSICYYRQFKSGNNSNCIWNFAKHLAIVKMELLSSWWNYSACPNVL